MQNKLIITLCLLALISGCASDPKVAVDPNSIKDKLKYQKDSADCKATSETYDLSDTTTKSAVAGAATGAAAVAGIATAVAGAVFLPAVPFIVAGGAIGGGAGSGISKSAETQARESILADCLNERGYKAYKTK
jgi:hypothetical protein